MRKTTQVVIVATLCAFSVIGGLGLAARVGEGPRASDSQLNSAKPTPAVTATGHPDVTVVHTSAVPTVPLSLTVDRLGLDALPILEYTDGMVAAEGGVDPDSVWDVVWWSGGGRPGTDIFNTRRVPAGDGQNLNRVLYTTYIYGHSSPNAAIFNDIRTLLPGEEIVVTTSGKTFRYAVQEVITVPKPDMPTDPRTTLDQPGRLLLVSCYRPDGYDPDTATVDNVVVIAQAEPQAH